MTEHNASPQRSLLPRPQAFDHSPPPTSRFAPESPETGESSRSGSLVNGTCTTDATTAHRPSQDDFAAHESPNGRRHEHAPVDNKTSAQHRRSHRHKSTGAFLLSDPFEEAARDARDNIRSRKPRTRRAGVVKGKEPSSRHSNEQAYTTQSGYGLGIGLSPDLPRLGNGFAENTPTSPPRGQGPDATPDDSIHLSQRAPSPHSSTSRLDMDSTQIVSMALNLSESRRMAQRRVSSQGLPPRLAPLPTDNNVAGALRNQLQQQRRVSRTVSPKPERGAMQRLSLQGKGAGSLQPPFDPVHVEGSFRYNFSNSTLARAQKAKDHLELLAQYRRVLELLPPMKPTSLSKVSTCSDPTSSASLKNSLDATSQIGRAYDPLQYIRNRKVRARERKTIDGENQGFGDVNRVTDWVDDVAKWVATRQVRTPGSPAVPPFSGADVFSVESPPQTHISRPSASTVKPKRPRNDWIVEPADLLADVYWMEQDDHKRLIEDRHWRRIFPQSPDFYRPLSRATDDASPGVGSTSSAHSQTLEAETPSTTKTGSEMKAYKLDVDQVASGARERARHKLQELRGFHRHTNSAQGHGHGHGHGHGLLRRRDSTSSSSDSDSQKRSKRGTPEDHDKDILEKQMMEMMAREAREKRLLVGPEFRHLKTRPSNLATPDPVYPNSCTVSRQGSRRDSRVDIGDLENKNASVRSRTSSPQRSGRDSLEVPALRGRRMSFGSESSVPNSPDDRASRRDNYFVPGIGADLSPSSSRPSSPSRNPFSKVKHIFRDRSRERNSEHHHEAPSSEKEDSADVTAKPVAEATPFVADLSRPPRSRNGSVGPEVKITSRSTGESHKSHRRTNSLRIPDPGAGLRSLFKGPRIDSVLKSGVSKVSELIWKKESEAEESDSSTTASEESDSEDRGRRSEAKLLTPTPSTRGRASQVKQERHYLDVMPPFVSTYESRDHSRHESASNPIAKPVSDRSTRFELLRPPRIDISGAADPFSDTSKNVIASHSRLSHIKEDRRSSFSLAVHPSNPRRLSSEASRNSRHFSVSEELKPELAPLSRRELARIQALMLSSGVRAMEICRRAHEAKILAADTPNNRSDVLQALGDKVSWPETVQLAPEEERAELLAQPISQVDIFPVTARILGTAIQSSRQRWETAAESFKYRTRTELIDGRIEKLHGRLQLDFAAMTRSAAEDADEVSGDIMDGQRRKVKAVSDVIDKLSRRRRRRFRWARRAGWLALEWLLVGFMWYVWFLVMIARIFLGVGKGVVRGVKWLLWL